MNCDFTATGVPQQYKCATCGFVANNIRLLPVRRICTAALGTTVAAVPRGPGTELKKLLGKIGITATENCSCNARASRMDEMESQQPGWCEANLDEIVGWLREEATKRKLPFIDAVGRMLIRRAIRNAKRNA